MRSVWRRLWVAAAGCAWPTVAHAQANKKIAEEIDATGVGPYVVPALVVVLAAVLMALALLRRYRR